MKKVLIGLIIGIILTVPVSVKAWGEHRIVTAHDYYIDRYDDHQNQCYIAYDQSAGTPHSIAISCVKQ